MTAAQPLPALLLLCAPAAAVLVLARRTGVGRRGTPEEYHAGGRLLSPAENGLAAAGEHPSATLLLAVAGTAALSGPAGLFCAAALLSAWPLVLLLSAEAVRNCGRFTLADVAALRAREHTVRTAAGIVSVTVAVLCVAAQTAGAAALVRLLPVGAEPRGAVFGAAAAAGALVVLRALYGGMRTTTRILAAATVPLLVCACALTAVAVVRAGGPAALAEAAGGRGGPGTVPALSGHGGGRWAHADLAALGLALVLGTAGLPHVLARLTAVPTARAARRSVVWAAGAAGLLCPAAVLLGLGAAVLSGAVRYPDASGGAQEPAAAGGAAVRLLAAEAGGGAGTPWGTVLPAAVAAVCLTAAAAAVAGTALASSAAVVRDLRAPAPADVRSPRSGRGPGSGRPGRETAAARAGAAGVAAAGVAAGLLLRDVSALVLLGLALAVAASTGLPVLLYTLFRRRFTARGARWALCGGLAAAVVPTVLSPVVSGHPQALLPGADFAVFPLCNPAPLSVPAGFLAGWLGTLLPRGETADAAAHAETEVRALTGAGSA
ncbi:sodium:solute symporter family transporter [Streptomyces sp. URMC 125]|uniref:sodium:solute symporter family transporter n=1 Tax=Streptomyces sp. URMC 125 TaxID=3423419 RepID=UPI003F19E5A3